MSYFERLWKELPDARPEHFEMRRDFLLATLVPGSRIIDVGCGGGWFAGELARAGFAVVGCVMSFLRLTVTPQRSGQA